MQRERHVDFQRILTDFLDLRSGEVGHILYGRFLDHYGLDESQPYEIKAQKRMQKHALRSPTHLRIKRNYPRIDFDRFITGRRKADRVRLRTDHPVKLRVRNLGGRRLNIRLGGGEKY